MAGSILLYRFLGAKAALKSIEQRRMRVGRIKDFNDPFEWRVGITGIIPEGEAIAQAYVESLIAELNDLFGVICFSDTVREPVLWSHYAEQHTGVAFEFDHLIEPGKLQKIAYADERPVIDANRMLKDEGLREYLIPLVEGMIFQKARCWSYEREYRVHMGLENCEVEGGTFFTRIPDSFLTRVILGFRCPLEERIVTQALQRSGLSDTRVVRAAMDQTTYTIRC